MSGVKEILIKEVKETFRNPRYLIFTILFPLLIYPVMGYVFGLSFTSAQQVIATGEVLIVDQDNSTYSKLLITYLHSMGLNVSVGSSSDLNSTKYLMAIIIPKGFQEKLLNGSSPQIETRVNIGSLSFMTMGVASAPQSFLNSFKEYLGRKLLEDKNINPDLIYNPFNVDVTVYVKEWGKTVSQYELNMLSMQVYIWPWILFGLIISILQISSAFLSEEKEQKTLEILLTLPIDRKSIVLGKILGSSIVAVSATISYIVGFALYIVFGSSFFNTIGQGFSNLFQMPTEGVIWMTILFFLELLLTAGLGLGIAVFTQDTKAAESLSGSLSLPLMLLILAGSMLDIESLPIYFKYIYYAIPYSYMLKSFEHMLIGDYSYFIYGMIITLIWLVIIMYIVSKIFASERLLTMRVSFGFGRRKREHS